MNLASVLLARVATDRDAIALRTDAGAITYSELDDRSGTLAGELHRRLTPGSRVGIVTGNVPLFVVSYLAVLRSGMVAVPLDPTAPPRELSRALTIVGAE